MKTVVLVILFALMVMSVASRRALLPQGRFQDFPKGHHGTNTGIGKFSADPSFYDPECFEGCIEHEYDNVNLKNVCNSECSCQY